MVHAQKRIRLGILAPTAVALFFSGAIFAQQQQQQEGDPPSRVARLNYISGNVSMEPAGVDDWAPAELNRPFTTGDYLYADQGGMAELHLDVAVIRMGAQTSFGFLNLDDRTVQLKLTEGDLSVRIRNFNPDQVFEVDTPNAAVTLLRDGVYRFRVDPNGTMSFVVVRSGQAEVTGGGRAFTLNPDNSATLNGTDQLTYDIELAPEPDQFDQWCTERDQHEARLASSRYLPPTMVGYEDLDDYGTWSQASQYGPVWYPNTMPAGWAPYHYGHWAWIDPWGWTWIDAQPWGFAPFHYGRWVYIGARWAWSPGPVSVVYHGPVVRPWYAPALVAWFGGAHWGVGISVGGPSLGWVPLGWGEVYTPAYHCSPRYFNNVNVYNTRIVNNVNITNVYKTVYVNKTVYNQNYVNVHAPNAVMAMPQSAFASGRMVRQAGVVVPASQVAQVRTAAMVAPPVAPTRQSFLASASNRTIVRPPAQVMRQAVVARSTPPPAPAPFAARQKFLQQHAATGQPLNVQAMHQTVAAERVEPNVRRAPAATPVAVKPGERSGALGGNREMTPAAQPGPAPIRQPNGARPGENQPAYGRQQPQAERPETQRPVSSGHGVPPDMRQQPMQEESNGRSERTQQNTQRTQPSNNRPAAQPYGRSAQQPQRAQPQSYPAARTQERNQPSERPQQQQQRSERQSERNTPERRSYPARSPEPHAQQSHETSRPASTSREEHSSSHDNHKNK